MKISQKLTLSLLACVFMSQMVESKHKSDKSTKIAPISSDKYEQELNSALSKYLAEITSANSDQSKITKAMDRYDNELTQIDQRYPDQVKREAQEHAQKMAAQKAKWHNFDVATKALRTKYSKQLAPYWKAEQEIARASFNKNTEHDLNLRKKARVVYEAAMQALNFEYRHALSQFNEEQQKLFQQYNV